MYPNFNYCVYKSQPLVPTLSPVNLFYVLPPHFIKTHFETFFPARTHVVTFPHIFQPKPVCTSPLPHTCEMFCQSHSSLQNRPENIWSGVLIAKPLDKQSRTVPCTVPTFSVLGPNILLPTLCRVTTACVLHLMPETKFHFHTKQQENYSLVNFTVYISGYETRRQNILNRKIMGITWIQSC
jgi:hypothetical protein